MAISAVKKRIHVSKNKKKSWNKYSDIKDIEEFLEDKRREERLGGTGDEKPNDQLFFVQTKVEDPAELFPRNKKDVKNLRCFQTLTAYSKVLPPIKPSTGCIGKKRKNLLLLKLEKSIKKIKVGKDCKKQNDQEKRKEALSQRKFHDLWSEETNKVDSEVVDLIDYRDEMTKKKSPKVPCYRYQKPSLLPSVEVPHPGASYNPSFEEHQALLKEALLIEEKKVKEEKHLQRVLTDFFPKPWDTPLQEVRLQEMSEGLFEEPDAASPEDNHVEGHFEMGNPPVRADDRKTRAQKRKQRERKQEKQQRQLMKLDKIRNDEFYRLKCIKYQLKQEEALSLQKQKARDQRKIDKLSQPHTLSAYKYTPQDLEVNLSEELSGSLRTMKSEGSLLEDRYKSLIRRNIMESRTKQKMKRKYKLKVQIKRSHRGDV